MSHKGRIVLLVEDDQPTREMYRGALRAAGYAVVAVEDGADALRVLDQERPSVVVLDLGLPRLGGRDVLRDLRARSETQSIPVVVVTGSEVTDLVPDPGVSLLRKPIHPETLAWEVREAISRSRRRQGA